MADAVCAASFHRLAYYGNSEFEIKAERYKASAIRRLMVSSQSLYSTHDCDAEFEQMTAAAVVIVLLYDDMISAQDYYCFLVPLIKSLLKTVRFSNLFNQDLARFLALQLKL